MTNNTRGVVDPLVHLVALLGDDVLAVLDIGGVHDSVVLGVADRPGHLARVLDGSLLALPFGSGMALGATGVGLNPLAHLVALLSDNILAVLDVGGVHNHVILLMTNLPGHLSRVLNRPLLA